MKKLLFIMLTVITLVSFTACSPANKNGNNADTSDDAVSAENSTADGAGEETSSNEETETNTPEVPAKEEITITHELGETALTTNPERVVVFDYGLLDALDYAGVDTIIGVPQSGTLPEHLSKFTSDTYGNAGSLKEADFEIINELKPDLILITGRMSDSYVQLSEIAPTIYLPMPSATYIASFEQNLNTLASIFTKQADSFTSEIANVKTLVSDIKEKVTAGNYSGLIIQANDGEISVFGYGSRYAILYDDLGFTLLDETIEESTHGQAASFEYVAEQNPDFLFVVDRSAAISSGDGQSGAAQLLDNELINGTDAAKNNRITYLNSTNWYTVSGGITSTLSMLQEVSDALE